MGRSEQIEQLYALLNPCELCPRLCRVNRPAGQKGVCRIGDKAIVASAMSHHGEEKVLVGAKGSGTIFMAGCNLRCAYCQNEEISQSSRGTPCSPEELADLAMQLEQRGCANINFVTPTHVAPFIAEGITIAREKGLQVPVVYNSGGYDAVASLKLLDGLIDIYMPDFKYASAEASQKYSEVEDYPEIATAALEEMYNQVGQLTLDDDGLARRGVLVRHLVLPKDIALSRDVILTVAQTAPACAINIMSQYRAAYRAYDFPELLERVSGSELADLRNFARLLGLDVLRD